LDKPRKPKSAELVARQLERRIIARKWPVGESLGSATELEAEYNISRPTFREAVRILENRRVASMRRGPGGGLFVTEPSQELAADGAAMYLLYRRVSFEDLSAVRRSLELTSVELAVSRIDEDGIGVLRTLIDSERDSMPSENEGIDPEIVDMLVADSSAGIHFALADLSGNAALSLFVRITVGIMSDRLEIGRRGHPSVSDVRQIHAEHEAICDAVVSGDASLARHRMQRHLDQFYRSVHTDAG
jgi:DNA-binding FadR family transcriptional regulator